jgi:hypothetical protein
MAHEHNFQRLVAIWLHTPYPWFALSLEFLRECIDQTFSLAYGRLNGTMEERIKLLISADSPAHLDVERSWSHNQADILVQRMRQDR